MLDAFLQSIAENPGDEDLYLILADWLEERDDPRAELVRLQHALRQPGIETNRRTKASREHQVKEDRMRQLVAAGVQPCLPTLTNSIGMKLTLIPPGAFLMGSRRGELKHETMEAPQREVTISQAFYLGVYPVTQREYKAVMHRNPSHFHSGNQGGPDHPVDQVTWTEAVSFCRRLSAMKKEKAAGRGYRLPTEAEWEHACRAGTTTAFWWGDIASSRQANFNGAAPYGRADKGPLFTRTTKVGSYQANPWGLFDVHGNVWEWCTDWFDEDYYAKGENNDPQGPKSGRVRALRGGRWYCDGQYCRSACRNYNEPDNRNEGFGFRVAMTLSAQAQ